MGFMFCDSHISPSWGDIYLINLPFLTFLRGYTSDSRNSSFELYFSPDLYSINLQAFSC